MKKGFSCFFFALMIAVFIFELYFSIAGAIDVNAQLAELEASGESGHALLGVGTDILVFGVVLLSALGLIISLVSCKMAQRRVVKIVSAGTCPLFLLPILVSVLILTV
ncbi:MAG: hypothetical protein E7651_01135 [Ruminococcaceae bacterium]|nr:hypothetical protein [Oscillospiraceae bacterium]